MARAGPSRSQRAPQASQSQPSGSRRNTRRTDVESEEEGEEDVQAGNDEEDDQDVDMEAEDALGNKGDELTRKANNLVRLALFTEHRRMPLRRDEINKKGMGFFPAVDVYISENSKPCESPWVERTLIQHGFSASSKDLATCFWDGARRIEITG